VTGIRNSSDPVNIGIDVGMRRLAVASWDLGFAKSFELKAPTPAKPANRANELNQLGRWLWDVLMDHQVQPQHVVAWVERSYVGNSVGNPATALALAETVGMVLSTVLWGRAERVDASTWKMNLLGPGHGHASKGEVSLWLSLEWPQLYQLCETEDEKDAMCISLYGQMRHDGKVGPPTKSARKRASVARGPASKPTA